MNLLIQFICFNFNKFIQINESMEEGIYINKINNNIKNKFKLEFFKS